MTSKEFSFYLPPHFLYKDEAGTEHAAQMKPTRSVTLRQLFDYIKNDKTAERLTNELRQMTDGEQLLTKYRKEQDANGVWRTVEAGTETKKKQFKNTRFCFVQAAGVFSGRRADQMKEPSGFWCVDFDHFANSEEELKQAKDALLADELARPALVFTSPSGDGLKAFFLFDWPEDDKERKARVRGLYRYLQSKHASFNVDTYTDAGHCCNVPHDEDARLNEDAFTKLDWTFWRVEDKVQHLSNFVASSTDEDKSRWYVEELVRSGIDVTAGMTHEDFLALAHSFTALAHGEELFLRVSSLWPKFTEANARNTWRLAERQSSRADVSHFYKLAVAALGRTWEKETLAGQKATEEFKRQKREEWLQEQKKKRQMKEQQMTAQAQEAQAEQNELTENELQELILRRPSLQELIRNASELAVSIPTEYVFGIGEEQEPLTLKSRALTVIGAGTSHGKTRFLENLLLSSALYEDEDVSGTCLFFTLEECLADVLAELVNLYANRKKVRTPKDANGYWNNFAAYADTFRRLATGQKRFFDNEDEFKLACDDVRKFGETFTESGLVRIFEEERFRDVDELCSACRLFASQNKLKAVFLDHLGMMTESGTSALMKKTERVERIVTKLEQLAKELNVPVVLTQQLARSASSPLKLENGNLADSADVERSANTVLLLWNSSVLPVSELTHAELVKQNGFAKATKALEENGFFFGVRGALFAKITKRRGGLRDVWTVLHFDGATGKVEKMTDDLKAELEFKAKVPSLEIGETLTLSNGETVQKQRERNGRVLTCRSGKQQAEKTPEELQFDDVREASRQQWNNSATPENVQHFNEQLAAPDDEDDVLPF